MLEIGFRELLGFGRGNRGVFGAYLGWFMPQAKEGAMAGLAVFVFKSPSLLQFERRWRGEGTRFDNLHRLFGIDEVPSDETMRRSVRNSVSHVQNHSHLKPLVHIHKERDE